MKSSVTHNMIDVSNKRLAETLFQQRYDELKQAIAAEEAIFQCVACLATKYISH
jgi:hypothetical protein